jgi:hypothetical protein
MNNHTFEGLRLVQTRNVVRENEVAVVRNSDHDVLESIPFVLLERPSHMSVQLASKRVPVRVPRRFKKVLELAL